MLSKRYESTEVDQRTWIKYISMRPLLSMIDFIFMGFAELWATGRNRKNQNENIFIHRESNQVPSLSSVMPLTIRLRWQLTIIFLTAWTTESVDHLSCMSYFSYFNHASLVAVVTPTDRAMSVRNLSVMKVFGGRLCVVTLLLGIFCWWRGFCHIRIKSELFLFLLHLCACTSESKGPYKT